MALRFTELYLKNWRNFSEAKIKLQRRAFFVGPNASGKSNLLDVFRFLRDITSVGGGFQESVVGGRGGVSRIRCLSARMQKEVVVRVSVGDDESPTKWKYELQFDQDEKKGRPVIRGERISGKSAGVDLKRPLPEDAADPERLIQTYLEQVNVNKDFRELADFFRSVGYLHIVPQLIREPDRSVGHPNDPYGGDLLEQIARRPPKYQARLLKHIGAALRVAVPQLKQLELWRDERGTPHLRGKYEHWREHGAWQTEDQFSDGTLRLLGLLWSALEQTGPLLLEEPELSLHQGVVRFLPQMFGRIQRKFDRQIFISTHSADLLQDPGIGVDEVFLLIPSAEGTDVQPASGVKQIKKLLVSGSSLGEIAIPLTQSEQAQQLTWFGDQWSATPTE